MPCFKNAPCVATLRVRRCRRFVFSSFLPSPCIAKSSLRYRIAISSLSPYCGFVVVARIAGSSLSPYCGFVAVAILRVRRCRHIAGSSLSPYCGFVAVAILRVLRCRRIAGSSLSPYSGFVAVAV